MKKAFILVIFIFSFFLISSCQTSFSKQIWLKEENNDITTKNNPRMKMTEDLMTNYLKKKFNY